MLKTMRWRTCRIPACATAQASTKATGKASKRSRCSRAASRSGRSQVVSGRPESLPSRRQVAQPVALRTGRPHEGQREAGAVTWQLYAHFRCGGGCAYLPEYFAARFSAKARRPSLRSSLASTTS
jgi:hypothetical protein